jgi:hypothetical protein
MATTKKKTTKKTAAKDPNKIVALCDGKRIIICSAANENTIARELYMTSVDRSDTAPIITIGEYISDNFDRYETTGTEKSICIDVDVHITQKW